MRVSVMLICCIAFVSTILLSGAISFARQSQQDEWPRYGFPPESRIESRYGQPGQADVTAHKHVSKDLHLKCIKVEHNPQHDDGATAACVLKFDGGNKHTLHYGEAIKSPKDGEVYLECLGGRPALCEVGTW